MIKNNKNLLTERNKLISQIAELYYLQELTQDKIAERLNLSRTQVFRYLKEAKEKNIVEIKVKLLKEEYTALENIIEKMYGIERCIVIESSENTKETLKHLGSKFSKLMTRYLDEVEYLAIGWGRTIYNMLLNTSFDKSYNVNVLPAIGSLGIFESEIHSNTIVKIFSDLIGGKNIILNAPAIINSKKSKEILENEESIKKVLNYFKRVDIAVLGLSELSKNTTFSKSINLSNEQIKSLESLGVIGEIIGLYIDGNGNFVSNEINDRMISISLDEIRKVDKVIGMSSFTNILKDPKSISNRANVFKVALKSKLINILVVSKEIAEELIKVV
jgi:DNA-binding transcriptional regulator LsrR (DeoR family)